MADFGFETTTDEVLERHDLTGKTVLVTGGYSGLGRETARAMGAKGAHVILSGRDEAKLAGAAEELAKETGATFDTLTCDLASLDSVRAAAKEASERFGKLDLLINNAGVMACPKGKTADGFERQFGTNHLGHFLLSNLLVPLLEKGNAPRIIALSSRAHFSSPVHLEDPNYENREYEKWESYGQSKTANALFALAADKRFKSRGIRAFSVHPGGIMTNLGRHLSEEDVKVLRARLAKAAEAAGKEGGTSATFKTVEQGAATTCWAATSDDVLANGGAYCEDCHVAPVDDESPVAGVRSYAADPDAAEKLWVMSEDYVAEKFPW
ncbi:SDR family NAD(P)-dependent oxidoreductase [Altererythrobacter sp. MF3-039]|uniref:SDR family NAD(P)-dependent oxidoreductase n=1 Tax=Altererythrobacter sp. MF3-039 TaxID=3252901 RepID=UPI00390C5B8E